MSESQVSREFVARLAQRLASRQPKPRETERESYGPFHESAAVLSSFQIDRIQPVGGARDRAEVSLLMANSMPATDGGEGNRRILGPDVRIATLRQLRETGRLGLALGANPEAAADVLQRALRDYLAGKAKPLTEQSLDELAATYQVSAWMTAAGFEGVPTVDEIQRRTEWLKILHPFEHIAGTQFRGRQVELKRLREYVEVLPPGSALDSARRRLRADAETTSQIGSDRVIPFG